MKNNVKHHIGFIGAGNIGSAIISRLAKNIPGEYIHIHDTDTSKCSAINNNHSVVIESAASTLAKNSDIIIFALKPDILLSVIDSINDSLNTQIIVSIAAGITIEQIQKTAGRDKKIIRVMPNTPSLAGEGMSVLAANANASESDISAVEDIFARVGKTKIVQEKLMDAVTGLSGSGPAFVFTFIQALADGGVKMGLPRDTAQLLAAQTVLGSARLVLESSEGPISLRGKVASPGGTTIEGIHILEKAGFSGTVMDAVEAAVLKSKSLGE